jgi:hypothetical protein
MATGSGRRLIYNTREQVLSTDMNRSEAFAEANQDEILRFLLASGTYPGFVFPTTGQNIAGFTEDHTVTETPTYGQVIGGLLCRPIDNTMNVVIDPGVALVVDPDPSASPDDSPYKLIRDPGATVTLTQNISGQTRIDVLECSRLDLVTESDSRNQYDTTTGLFTAVSFNKVAIGQFQYRIRAGTAGAGVPSPAQGWMPLMVIGVPTGTVTQLNACSFWDVRPLVSGKYRGGTNRPEHFYHFKYCRGTAYISGSNVLFEAQAEVCDQWGYRLGGNLQIPGAGGNIGSNIDVTNAGNQEAGFTITNGQYYYVYLAVPFANNLPLLGPRWVRYGRYAGGALQPIEPVGMVVVSKTAPDEVGAAVLSAPTSSGLSCQLRGYCIGLSWMAGGVMDTFIAEGNRFVIGGYSLGAGARPLITGGTATANVATWTMTAGTDFPKCARSVQMTISAPITPAAGQYYADMNLLLTQANGGSQIGISQFGMGTTPTQGVTALWDVKVPTETNPITGDGIAVRTLTLTPGLNVALSASLAIVVAFEF